MLSNFKQQKVVSEKHRRFIASLPCCVTGLRGEVQAAHIRSGFFGMGAKPGDDLCLPLHWRQHLLQHEIGEEAFWKPYGGIEAAKELARNLYQCTGDECEGRYLITKFIKENLCGLIL